MALVKQSSRYQPWLIALSFTLLVDPALADDAGDTFINNLLTDIAPILALFGECVTTQFLSHSFSVYDCIIFAACPIGIVTAAVSAIRVAAPNAWRSLIGRAMESQATTELELLSSTSPDVCELWSGSAVVRVMGSPGILELLYFPKLDKPEDHNPVHFGLFTLNEKIQDRPEIASQWPQMEGRKLHRQSLFEGKGTGLVHLDHEAMKPSTRHRQASPSISMNLSSFFNGSAVELRLITIFGVLVQLCVVGYSAMITYYGSWTPHFKKDGEPVRTAAFPLLAVGTVMVSGGMFICALVIEKCTDETAWTRNRDLGAGVRTAANPQAGEGAEFRLLWLQKHKVVNDQAFESCAIMSDGPRTKLLTSDASNYLRTDAVPPLLKFGSMTGVLISLVGFILQFSGLRLMNWSATLAQLIGMAIMTVTRAYMRIRLADRPKTLPAIRDYELDWLASQFVTGSDDLWDPKDKTGHEKTRDPPFSWLLGRDEVLFEPQLQKPEEECDEEGQDDDEEEQEDVEEQDHREDQNDGEEQGDRGEYYDEVERQDDAQEQGDELQPGEQQHNQSHQLKRQKAMKLWKVRQRLGFLSPWTSDHIDISKAVSLAIESVMGILRAVNAEPPLITDSFRWSLKGRCSDLDIIPFTLSLGNDERCPWGSPSEIEAALSTWSYFLSQIPEERKVVRSLEHGRRSFRQDIALWAGRKETGLLVFDLVEEVGQPVPHEPLSRSTRPISTLLAQRVFLWFMLDLAENLSSRLPKAPTVTFFDNDSPSLEAIRLDHPTLTAMVQKIQQSGLASTEEAWDMVILPLSFHQKLPSPVTIVEKMRDRSKNFEQTGQWKKVLKIQKQVVKVCQEYEHETDMYHRAAAIVVDTYLRISSILDVQVQQFRRQHHLTQLQLVKRHMKEMIPKGVDRRTVQALLHFYKLQKRQSPCLERFEAGWLEMTFKSLRRSFRRHDTEEAEEVEEAEEAEEADDTFNDVAEAIQDLPTEIKIREGTGGNMLQRGLHNFDWGLQSSCFPDPLGLTLTHYVVIRGVKNVGPVLDLVGPESDLATSVSDIAGWTPLHYVAMASEVQETMVALWRHGGSVHAQSRDGTTPLHCLARTGNKDEVSRLLDLGAIPTAQDNVGYTPLHWAAWCGNVAAIDVLLTRGADPGSRDNYGRTALHLATIAWKSEVVAALSYKTDIGTQDVDGNTALHYAALLGNRALASQENHTKEDNAGKTGENGKAKEAEEEVDAEEDDALVTALFRGQNQPMEKVEKSSSESKAKRGVFRQGLDWKKKNKEQPCTTSQTNKSVNPSSEEGNDKSLPFGTRLLSSLNVDGNAPIHVAIEHGHLGVVERLLRPKEQERETANGITPLQLAVVFGRSEVAENLVRAGAYKNEFKPKELLERIDRLQKFNERLSRPRVSRVAELRITAHSWAENGDIQGPFFAPFTFRLWHRMQGKSQGNIESLREAYGGTFSVREFNRERTYASAEYLEKIGTIKGILDGEGIPEAVQLVPQDEEGWLARCEVA